MLHCSHDPAADGVRPEGLAVARLRPLQTPFEPGAGLCDPRCCDHPGGAPRSGGDVVSEDRALANDSTLEKVADPPDSVPAPEPGATIGRYELVRVLGSGGFGVVYEARDRQLERRVALKLFRVASADPPPRFEWFAREAKVLARLSHPSIVTLHDYGEHDRRPYLVLELLRGATLAELLLRGPLAPARALAIAIGVARALDHAHRARVIHLDLKPSNVFIGEDDHVTVLDFGLARLVPNRAASLMSATAQSSAAGLRGAGTPAFMAPEQLHGDADAR